MSATAAPVRRAEFIGVMSLAADLAIGQPLGFGLRSAIGGVGLARAAGFGETDIAETYYQALLRYSGCTAETDTLNALFGDEISLRQDFARLDPGKDAEVLPVIWRHLLAAKQGMPPLAMAGAVISGLIGSRKASAGVFAAHCEAAARLAGRLGLSAAIQRNLGQLYERWDGRGLPQGLKGSAIAPAVRVVTLTQDALVLSAALPAEQVAAVIRSRSGGAYEPRLVDCFLPLVATLLAPIDDAAAWQRALAVEPADQAPLAAIELDAACEALADFIDLKSPVIAGHSRAVSHLAAEAAAGAGLPSAEVELLRRAGLLHDLGYAALPGPSRFAAAPAGEGVEQTRLHPYYGERLLGRVPGLAMVGAIVSEHHERLDGSGYFRGSRGPEQSLAGRVLAAVEAYQSLIEDRPFRVTLAPVQAAGKLREAARLGELDGEAVSMVLDAAGQPGRGKKPMFVAGLTAREIEVLCLLAVGRTMKEMARDLGLAPKTVDNHLQAIYGKLEVKTRAGATLFALEHGLLRPGQK